MNFIDKLNDIVGFINDNILWGIPMIIAILLTGMILSVRARFLQVRKFGKVFTETIVPTFKKRGKKDKPKRAENEKTISQFEAFSAALAGTVGTGNIIGVASAMLAGGPGAVFWMWVSAFFGLMTSFAENVLGNYFRKKDKDGNVSGGPMYYIENGLGKKWLALIFSACCLLAAVGMGMVQSNSISGTIQNVVRVGSDKVIAAIVGVAVALIIALVIIGGIKRIGRFASLVVPFMAVLFIVMACSIIGINITRVPHAFALIFKGAFSLRSVGGGLLGYTVMTAMRFGFARGIFSNEAGLGSGVIAQSTSETKEPVQQGLWGVFGVFFDTFVICTLTALTLLCTSGDYFMNIGGNAGADATTVASSAFSGTFGLFGEIVFAIILPLFAFTTILAWSFYGEKAIEYLFGQKTGKKAGTAFKVLYVLLLVVGAIVKSDFVWSLDDMFNALMALPNLAALILLSGLVVKISKNYFERKAGKDVLPMLSAYPERNRELAARLHEED